MFARECLRVGLAPRVFVVFGLLLCLLCITQRLQIACFGLLRACGGTQECQQIACKRTLLQRVIDPLLSDRYVVTAHVCNASWLPTCLCGESRQSCNWCTPHTPVRGSSPLPCLCLWPVAVFFPGLLKCSFGLCWTSVLFGNMHPGLIRVSTSAFPRLKAGHVRVSAVIFSVGFWGVLLSASGMWSAARISGITLRRHGGMTLPGLRERFF